MERLLPPPEQLHELIANSGSKLVSVTFVKKSTGEPRQISFNPKDYLPIKGTGAKRNEETQKYIRSVVEFKTRRWRSFDARTVLQVKMKGDTYQ